MTIFGVLAQFSCARDRERHLSSRLPGLMLALTLGLGTLPAPAQEIDDGPPPTEEAVAQALATQSGRGPVTNLPLPRYVSLKGSEGNARRGPSLSHRIDWVFTHAGMPLRITAEFGHWRRVEDRDGAGGWVHYSLLSGVRTVIVEDDMTELHARADAKSAVVALAEMGAVAKLGDCTLEWCEISAEEADGWVQKTAIWGVDPDEIRD
ncbi:SH3-like domain-containing protein [Rhodobacter viridis]|uniref:SH3-like domain-containing protein n=2 Tax=Rhodobacter viridis TaxID=1054202 RepID=A0A318U110_9RHOB|nr:SH3 domain-containing protein [Rhodobacter viridis]PYF11204.1 SH3-like domain-containing protein [Rhodobacter viridis]